MFAGQGGMYTDPGGVPLKAGLKVKDLDAFPSRMPCKPRLGDNETRTTQRQVVVRLEQRLSDVWILSQKVRDNLELQTGGNTEQIPYTYENLSPNRWKQEKIFIILH